MKVFPETSCAHSIILHQSSSEVTSLSYKATPYTMQTWPSLKGDNLVVYVYVFHYQSTSEISYV